MVSEQRAVVVERKGRRWSALQHGLTTVAPVVTPWETLEEWEAHRERVIDDLKPRGEVERQLVERVALQLWRLRRVQVAEAAAIGRRMQEAASGGGGNVGYLLREDLADRLVRYEAHLSRELYRALGVLTAMREVGNGG